MTDRARYPYCSDPPNSSAIIPLDKDTWTQASSPWATPRDCVWPIATNQTRNCNPDSDWTTHSCLLWQTCGNNYDAFGNPRFSSHLIMRSADYIEDLTWGYVGFNNIFDIFLNLFECLTMEGWTQYTYRLMDAYGAIPAVLYFSSFVVVGAFFLLNLTLGILADQFHESKVRATPYLPPRPALGSHTLHPPTARRGARAHGEAAPQYLAHRQHHALGQDDHRPPLGLLARGLSSASPDRTGLGVQPRALGVVRLAQPHAARARRGGPLPPLGDALCLRGLHHVPHLHQHRGPGAGLAPHGSRAGHAAGKHQFRAHSDGACPPGACAAPPSAVVLVCSPAGLPPLRSSAWRWC